MCSPSIAKNITCAKIGAQIRHPVGDNDGPASNKMARTKQTKQAHACRQNRYRYRYMLPDDMPRGEYWDGGAMVGSPAVVAVPVSQNFSPGNATSIRLPLQETARGVVVQ